MTFTVENALLEQKNKALLRKNKKIYPHLKKLFFDLGDCMWGTQAVHTAKNSNFFSKKRY